MGLGLAHSSLSMARIFSSYACSITRTPRRIFSSGSCGRFDMKWDPLADMILAGKVPDGANVAIDEGDGELAMTIT